jgi:hypothetical protein
VGTTAIQEAEKVPSGPIDVPDGVLGVGGGHPAEDHTMSPYGQVH